MELINLPLNRRPREQLISHGSERTSLHQLISILLGSGTAGLSVETLSSSVERLFLYGRVTVENLLEIPGIGRAKATIICAAIELGKRIGSSDQRVVFATALDIFNACRDLCLLPQENLAVFYLNVRNQAIEREIVTVGTASASLIHPREVFRSAIVHNASSIIVAHNHPSGSCEPSVADKQATRRLAQAGVQLGISVLDHVICSEHGFTSLRDNTPELFLLVDS